VGLVLNAGKTLKNLKKIQIREETVLGKARAKGNPKEERNYKAFAAMSER
jgi:hypothetical protein